MENAEKINVVPEKETSLRCAEQPDFPQIKVEQVDEVTVNENMKKLETTACNSTIQIDGNNVDINLNHKELKNESFPIDEDKVMKYKEASAFMKNNKIYEEEKPIDTTEKMTNKIKRRSTRKVNKNNQLSNDKKENLKKVNSGKAVKKKAKKSYKTSSKLSGKNILKQENEEPLENYTKVELYKINTEGCIKCNLATFIPVKSETKMYDTTKLLCPSVTRQQELNQCGLENNTNVLQHLDYNNLKYTNQQPMPATTSWVTVPRANENFTLNDSVNNTQLKESSYVNHKHHVYTVAADYNWKQNENPYFNSVINSTDPYKLFPENKTRYPCNIYGPNCICNNVCVQNYPRTNSMFQQATNNVAPNYAVLPVNTSNNFPSPATMSFNPVYYYQSVVTDNNLKKLYYPSLDNNGCELTIKKENVMPRLDNWHSNSLMIPSSNNFNMLPTTPTTWYNAPSSSFLDASTISNTSTISDVDKTQVKYEQNTYLTNCYNADMMKTNVYKDQWRDYFTAHVKPTLQNTLPPITTILTTPINTNVLQPYNTDNGLTSILTHQNNTATSIDENISNIADLSSETTAVNIPEELTASRMYVKDKKLISEVLESIL